MMTEIKYLRPELLEAIARNTLAVLKDTTDEQLNLVSRNGLVVG